MKKFAEHNWLELFLFGFSGVIAVGTSILIAHKDIIAERKGDFYSILLASAGFACSQLIIIIKKYIAYKKRLNIAVSCDYHKKLHNLGILNIYPKSRKTELEEGGYYYELQEELKRLDSNNRQNLDKKIIKMVGVSFNKFFGGLDDGIPSIIWRLSKKMHFQVMICDPKDNSELNFRLEFINEELKKYYYKKRDSWTDRTRDTAPIFNEIKTSLDNINFKKDGSKIDLCVYKFTPYATMIIVDDHIYYTPNVLEYKYFVEEEKLPPEFTSEFELSMCIDRRSEYGEKLEKLFDNLWNYGHVPIDDDSAIESKSKRNVFSLFK